MFWAGLSWRMHRSSYNHLRAKVGPLPEPDRDLGLPLIWDDRVILKKARRRLSEDAEPIFLAYGLFAEPLSFRAPDQLRQPISLGSGRPLGPGTWMVVALWLTWLGMFCVGVRNWEGWVLRQVILGLAVASTAGWGVHFFLCRIREEVRVGEGVLDIYRIPFGGGDPIRRLRYSVEDEGTFFILKSPAAGSAESHMVCGARPTLLVGNAHRSHRIRLRRTDVTQVLDRLLVRKARTELPTL